MRVKVLTQCGIQVVPPVTAGLAGLSVPSRCRKRGAVNGH
jgi:hypothetical protein